VLNGLSPLQIPFKHRLRNARAEIAFATRYNKKVWKK
jgi:hypothetical protein